MLIGMTLVVLSGSLKYHALMGILGIAVFILPVFLIVFGTDKYNVSMVSKYVAGCPYCGSECTHMIVDDRPFARSKITYLCTTVVYTRKTRYEVHRSDMCKMITDNQCDTI